MDSTSLCWIIPKYLTRSMTHLAGLSRGSGIALSVSGHIPVFSQLMMMPECLPNLKISLISGDTLMTECLSKAEYHIHKFNNTSLPERKDSPLCRCRCWRERAKGSIANVHNRILEMSGKESVRMCFHLHRTSTFLSSLLLKVGGVDTFLSLQLVAPFQVQRTISKLFF